MALTCGMIAMIDDAVGTILARLEEHGLAKNTVVVFTSDHGDFLGDHRLMLKGPVHYQGLIRVPFIWADTSDRATVGTSDAMCGTLDIASTILERTQIEPFNGIQGRSLLHTIAGDDESNSAAKRQFRKPIYLAVANGFLVISDFAYADICFDGYQAPSFLSAPGALDVGVEFTTMSKGYSMAGWRIGFCTGNAEMIRALATIKGYYDYGIFQPVQIAAIIAMRHCDAAVESITTEYQLRRDALCDGLERLDWKVTRPLGSMFVWTPIPEPWAEMGSIEFALKLLDEAGVACSPGRGFGEEGEGYLRLAIVENSQRLRQAVRQIDRCLKAETTTTGS